MWENISLHEHLMVIQLNFWNNIHFDVKLFQVDLE